MLCVQISIYIYIYIYIYMYVLEISNSVFELSILTKQQDNQALLKPTCPWPVYGGGCCGL